VKDVLERIEEVDVGLDVIKAELVRVGVEIDTIHTNERLRRRRGDGLHGGLEVEGRLGYEDKGVIMVIVEVGGEGGVGYRKLKAVVVRNDGGNRGMGVAKRRHKRRLDIERNKGGGVVGLERSRRGAGGRDDGGMRGTGSHDMVIYELEAKVGKKRKKG